MLLILAVLRLLTRMRFSFEIQNGAQQAFLIIGKSTQAQITVSAKKASNPSSSVVMIDVEFNLNRSANSASAFLGLQHSIILVRLYPITVAALVLLN